MIEVKLKAKIANRLDSCFDLVGLEQSVCQ